MKIIVNDDFWPLDNIVIKEYLIPTWIHQLTIVVSEDESEEDSYAECLGDYGGRCAEITIYPLFFNLSVEDQQDVLDHELVHLLTWPLSAFAEIIIEDDALLDEILLDLSEAVVEDTRRAINEAASSST